MIRTNLNISDIRDQLETLADELYAHIPVGVGARNVGHFGRDELIEDTPSPVVSDIEIRDILAKGMAFAVEKGLAWHEDMSVTENRGQYPCISPLDISQKARNVGMWQLGTLGSGNHYAEVQVVDEIYDTNAAAAMGILNKGQVCITIHCGSRGLGHLIASHYIDLIWSTFKEKGLDINDPQLAYAKFNSPLGREYFDAMSGAANFAFVNRSLLTMSVRNVFERVFGKSARQLDMHLIYDVSHNIASIEDHMVNGQQRHLLIHRKGSTKALPPHHPELPEKYKEIGQPVLVGGSMGTSSFVLTGCSAGNTHAFRTTCHGAGRQQSRTSAKLDTSKVDINLDPKNKTYKKKLAKAVSAAVLADLHEKGIVVRVASPDDIAEEGPDAYKDIGEVIEICTCASSNLLQVKRQDLVRNASS